MKMFLQVIDQICMNDGLGENQQAQRKNAKAINLNLNPNLNVT